MTINYKTDANVDYSSALLPPLPTLDSIMAGLPGLVGAFDGDDWSGSGNWLPRHGTGWVAPNTLAKGTREGDGVVVFSSAGKGFVNQGSGNIVPADLTYACRAYFSNAATNFQALFDLGAPAFHLRPTIPAWQYIYAPGSTANASIKLPIVGWHTVMFTKSGTDAALWSADGTEPIALGPTGALGSTKMLLGDEAGSSAAHEISRVVVCQSGDLTPEQRSAILTWVSL